MLSSENRKLLADITAVNSEIVAVIEKEVNILRWWQKALIWIGTAALVFVLGKIIAILILRKPI